jgi:hypothetical protein
MDPLSIAAGALAVLQSAEKTFKLLENIRISEKLTSVQLELEIYNKILEEVGQIALSGTSSLPESARLTLRLCQRHLDKVMTEMDDLYGSKPRWKSRIPSSTDIFEATLVKAMKNYRRSVKILRDIVME